MTLNAPLAPASWRDAAADAGRVVRLTGTSFWLSLGGALLIAVPDQSLESIRVLGEDAHAGDWLPLLVLLLCALFASVMSWYSARVLVYVLAPRASVGSAALRWSARHTPRIWGMVPMLGTGLALGGRRRFVWTRTAAPSSSFGCWP
jgi:hypothetical protein